MTERVLHLDWMKGIAIVCMVQVHTAAALPVESTSIDHPLAFLAAAIGGMAAPLFVTASGYGIHISASNRERTGREWVGWAVPRASVLFLFQIVVNLLFHVDRGGSFNTETPGVLTLFAASSLIIPLVVGRGAVGRAGFMILLVICPTLFSGHIGSDMTWTERIASDGIAEWVERLLLNGTYPLMPWFSYVLLGGLLAEIGESSGVARASVGFGMMFTLLTIVFSLNQGVHWALTEGSAILTFFPASTAFIIVSMSIVILVKILLFRVEDMIGSEGPPILGHLESAGRMSLTVYVGHFVILGLFVGYYRGEDFRLLGSLLVTLVHAMVWIPIASYYHGKFGHYSPEGMIKSFSSRLSK